jgi:hypothetical protein
MKIQHRIVSVTCMLILLLFISVCNANNTKELDPNIISSHLIGLIEAYEKGDIVEYAHNYPTSMEIIDNGVRLTIECETGQAEAVAAKAASFGSIEIVHMKSDRVQMVIPIQNISKLADIPGVRFVRLPIYGHPLDI